MRRPVERTKNASIERRVSACGDKKFRFGQKKVSCRLLLQIVVGTEVLPK